MMLENIIWALTLLDVALFGSGLTFIGGIVLWVMVALMIIDILGG